MTPRDAVEQACRALAAYRLRAVLSTLGMVVGIATIVTALAIGEGAQRAALAEIGTLGIDNVFVRAAVRESNASKLRSPTLTMEHAALIRQRVGGVRAAAVRSARGDIRAQDRRTTAPVIGVEPVWSEIAGVQLARGRWLTERDEAGQRRVAVLGAVLSYALFPSADPLGQDVKVNNAWYRIVGIAGNSAGGGPRPRSGPRYSVTTLPRR